MAVCVYLYFPGLWSKVACYINGKEYESGIFANV